MEKTISLRRHEERPHTERMPCISEKLSSESAFALLDELQRYQSESAAALLDKLRVYQIEIQLQNEELRAAQIELEASREKFSDLFEFSPIGYLVIDGNDAIQEANSTGAGMLAVEKSNLIKQKFSTFVLPEYQDDFYFHRQKVFETGKQQRCELKLLKKNGSSFYAQLNSITAPKTDKGARRLRTVIVDIGEGRRAVALEKSRKNLRDITADLMIAKEEERKRIAFELHDDLGQSLVLLMLRLRNAQVMVPVTQPELKSECESMGRLASGMLDTVRRISNGLTHVIHDHFSLTDSLRGLIDDFVLHADLSISVKMENMDGLFSPMAQLAIYRILQEALTNAMKHAEADHISVEAYKKNGFALFLIKDDGIGFDKNEVKTGLFEGNSGVGLTSMKERVSLLKGRFKIESQLSKGSQITFRIPIEPAATLLNKPSVKPPATLKDGISVSGSNR